MHSSAIHCVSIWHCRHMVDATSIACPNLPAKTQGLGEGPGEMVQASSSVRHQPL